MLRLRAIAALGVVAAALAALSPSVLAAQGVTTGAVTGLVTDESGAGVENAQVQVTNRATGYTAGGLTRTGGRYFVQGLELGNRYAVTVRLLGYAPQTIENINVVLGTATAVNFRLQRQATELAGVTVTATPAEFSPTRHGIATVVSDSALRKLPSLERNFTDFVALTPQVSTNVRTGGLSAGGVNNRFNHIQIDGASATDLFGLGATGQPGGQASGKSIAIESVKEYQVLLTPFDVRQGNFAGLLVNAVTKSGTNEFHGTAYGFTRGDAYTRSQPYIRDYENTQYGFAVGGPIVRDRAHFFINPEIQRVNEPASGVSIATRGPDTLLAAPVTRFTTLLGRDNIPAGSAGPVTNENPLRNIFGRVDLQLPWNTSLVLRHNYGRAEDDVFSRGSTSPYDFPLSSNAYFFESTKNSTVLQLRTQFSNTLFNELIAGYNTIRDRRTPVVRSPSVEAIVSGATLRAGAERFSHANELDQDMIEITNNVTWTRGAHAITIGGLANFYDVRNLFRQSSLGHWLFGSLDSLELRAPRTYIVGVPVTGDGAVRFDAAVYAGYLQDQWIVSPNLTVSGGLRFDVPVFRDRPPTNPAMLTQFSRDTRDIPSGNFQWSPRVSFNWDMTGDQRNQLRGGIGAFTGHPAYVWLSNAFQNSGLTGVALLTCSGSNPPPAFTSANIASPPAQCANGNTAVAGAEINLLAKDMRFPQTGRMSLGYDRDLGRGLVATLEGMYTVGMYSPFYENIALAGPQGVDENGRVMYGPRPGVAALRVSTRGQVFEARNSKWKDRYTQLTTGLKRRFQDNWEGSVFYTWSRARDVQTLTSSTAFSQLRFGRVWAGNLSETRATRSSFEQPHRIVATGVYTFPTRTSVALIYQGGSGRPFTYISSGDLNADNFTLNDPIYVPTAAEVSTMNFQQYPAGGDTVRAPQQAAAFEQFIQSTECLSENRGRILPRNECASPWTNLLNVSVSQALPVFRQQNVSVQLDIFNFLNLLNRDWGEQTFLDPQVTLLDHRGVTSSTGSLIVGAPTPTEHIFRYTVGQSRYNFSNIESNYQLQLSLRYSF